MNKHPDCEDRCQLLEHKGYHTCSQTGRCEQLVATTPDRSTTPRTDAVVDKLIPIQFLPQELIDVSRQLERELAEARAELLDARHAAMKRGMEVEQAERRAYEKGGKESAALYGPTRQAPDGTLYRTGVATGAAPKPVEVREPIRYYMDTDGMYEDARGNYVLSADYDALLAENARLREDVEAMTGHYNKAAADANEAEQSLAQLQKEVARWKKEAEGRGRTANLYQ